MTREEIITVALEWLHEQATNILWENFQPTDIEEESNIFIHKKYWYRAAKGMFEGKIILEVKK